MVKNSHTNFINSWIKQVSKDKDLENKSVKDQRPDFKENDMGGQLSGPNDEDEDHLKLDSERPDEEEDQPGQEIPHQLHQQLHQADLQR